MKLLENKNAVIIGAKGALGSKIAKKFKEYGANLFLSDINVEGKVELTEYGQIHKIDSQDENNVIEYFQKLDQTNIHLDVVINCSGSFPATYKHGLPAVDVNLEQFLEPLRSTTGAQFLSAREAYKIMRKNSKGVIIFITSTLAKVGAPWCPALTTSHAGTEGLMKSLANEWGPEGIRVLGVRSEAMPDSPTIHYTYETMGKNLGMSAIEMKNFIAKNKTALKRLPSTDETAEVVVMAASDMTGYMTGTMLNNSGGHIME